MICKNVIEINADFVGPKQGFCFMYLEILKDLFFKTKLSLGPKYIACGPANIGKNTELLKNEKSLSECIAVMKK